MSTAKDFDFLDYLLYLPLIVIGLVIVYGLSVIVALYLDERTVRPGIYFITLTVVVIIGLLAFVGVRPLMQNNLARILAMVLTVPVLAFGVGLLFDAGWMATISVGTALLGLSLLGLIAFAGYKSQGNRTLLLALFKPGLYIAIGALIALVVLHASLAIASIYLLESTGRQVHVGVIVMVGIGALAGVAALISGASSIIKKAMATVVGKRLSDESQPVLWEFILNLAKSLGASPPQYVVAGLEPNFFVTEADVRYLDGQLSGRTMYLSLPLCRVISQEELKAILGHELGHFKGLDTKFSRDFFPIYRGTVNALAGLAQNMGEGVRKIALIPALSILSFFLEAFSTAERAISRERELAADQVAAGATAPRTLATALVKVSAFSGLWGTIHEDMLELLTKGKQFTNISAVFARLVQDNSNMDALQGLDGTLLPHPTDSHPPLSQRLQALGISVADIADAALCTAPELPAVALIADYESFEKDLTTVEHLLMVESGQIRINAAGA